MTCCCRRYRSLAKYCTTWDCHLWGNAKDRSEISRYVSHHILTQVVQYLGSLWCVLTELSCVQGMMRGEELSQAYASGDVFVMPSESETLGFVVLEAMASQVPVVAVAAGGLTDIITAPGTNGAGALALLSGFGSVQWGLTE
jgi:glycosyltransferase involved in cell wall biosynthesis